MIAFHHTWKAPDALLRMGAAAARIDREAHVLLRFTA